MTLAELHQGEEGVIAKVKGRGAFHRRISEMGFVRGQAVRVLRKAPLRDPIVYLVMGTEVSLRRVEAGLIEVVSKEEAETEVILPQYRGVISEAVLYRAVREKGRKIDVALVGNPNCGKTTLFNHMTHSHRHVGNYSGVTVDAKKGQFKRDEYEFSLTDLPGSYSLSAYSPEELFVRKHLFEEMPDVVVNVVDASKLERNLYLTTQLIDMDIKVVMALNMYDELEEKGDSFDYQFFGKILGIPVVPMVSSRGKGTDELIGKVIDVYENRDKTTRHIHINYGSALERSLKRIQDELWKDQAITDRFSSRFLAIKLLEKDREVNKLIEGQPNYSIIRRKTDEEIKKQETSYGEQTESLITDARYGFIEGAMRETYTPNPEKKKSLRKKIDDYLTNRYLGLPLFFLFLWIMFQGTFVLGELPMLWIESAVGWLGEGLGTYMQEGMFKDLLIDGVIGGVGGVIVFLPNIVILFLFISLMEETGYMARAAFMMDKLMHLIGLHGQSFIPLIMGFGCNVPAIMASRTLRNRQNRLLTILINPFMSCSARLPVYILIIGAFFDSYAGTVLFSVYLTGIVLAILMAILFRKLLFKGRETPFVMELPPYRVPTLRSVLGQMWHKASQYLRKMGGIILAASIIIWALSYFPRSEGADQSRQQENSFIGQTGKFMAPVFSPLGFDWKMGVSLLTGTAAKETIVSSLGVLYHADEDGEALEDKLKEARYENGPRSGQKVFTNLSAISYLLFVLIYFPCMAVFVAIMKEAGWKWALFVAVYTTSLAWLLSFITYQLGTALGF